MPVTDATGIVVATAVVMVVLVVVVIGAVVIELTLTTIVLLLELFEGWTFGVGNIVVNTDDGGTAGFTVVGEVFGGSPPVFVGPPLDEIVVGGVVRVVVGVVEDVVDNDVVEEDVDDVNVEEVEVVDKGVVIVDDVDVVVRVDVVDAELTVNVFEPYICSGIPEESVTITFTV